MRLEHVALNVDKPRDVAAWYAAQFGMRIVKQMDAAPFAHFLADDAGMMLEIYNNPPDQVPEYRAMDVLQLHVAFACRDADATKEQLLAAGAVLAQDLRLPDGSVIITMRDPWGLAIQLCQRSQPLA